MSKVTEFKIDGMSCGHCVTAVTKALESVPGVEKAEVSLPNGSAKVWHRDPATTAQMVSAVEEEGYEAQAK